MRNILICLITFTLLLQLSACSGPAQGPSGATLRIGILPDENTNALRERYRPLLEFLSQETGLSYELIIPGSYEELVNIFGQGQIDLAYFGGATFVEANHRHNAIPLVMRDVDTRFTSVLVVADQGLGTLKALRGRSLSFGSRLSTSGHLMPRDFLQTEHGIEPEDYFRSIQYSGKHDRTAYWVRDGKVDAGIVNAEIIRKMLSDGRLRAGDIRIIWTTPPYTDYVWTAHPNIHPVNRDRIQQAFLQLGLDNPQHDTILSNLGASGFYPASVKDFADLRQTMAGLGVLQQ